MSKVAKSNIQVAVRIRPFLPQDNDKATDKQLLQIDLRNKRLRLPLKSREPIENNISNAFANNNNSAGVEQKIFSFDHIFNCNATQQNVYDDMNVNNLVEQSVQGYNATVFAYGHTGSGKTHTVVGDLSDNSNSNNINEGIISRAVKGIFAALEEKKQQQQEEGIKNTNTEEKIDDVFNVKCTYVQIYNESVYDLLSADFRTQSQQFTNDKALKLRWSHEHGFFLENIYEVTISSYEDFHRFFKKATLNRVFASNQLNINSSRSHCILSLIIERKKRMIIDANIDDEISKSPQSKMMVVAKSRLRFVDLAGSERVTIESSGTSLKESISINKSLHVLRKVVVALASGGHDHIPYRDSMLTSILQHSFGGNCVTLMIACLSPGNSFLQENMSTMRYASLASQIRNFAVINVDPTHRLITKLKMKVSKLQYQLQHGTVHSNSRIIRNEGLMLTNNVQQQKRLLAYFKSMENNMNLLKDMKQALTKTKSEKEKIQEEMKLLLIENEKLKKRNKILSHHVFEKESVYNDD
jgi:kinesin family member 21